MNEIMSIYNEADYRLFDEIHKQILIKKEKEKLEHSYMLADLIFRAIAGTVADKRNKNFGNFITWLNGLKEKILSLSNIKINKISVWDNLKKELQNKRKLN